MGKEVMRTNGCKTVHPPTYGPDSNTLSVAISPGTFIPGPGGAWQLSSQVDASTSQAFHPLVILGPQVLANIDETLPSGTVARILTDLFMRPATVLPQLSLQQQMPQRLPAVVQGALQGAQPGAWLDGTQFHRAAVTLEADVRATPRLLPTREACFLMSGPPAVN